MRGFMMKHGWLTLCLFIITAAVALVLIMFGQIQRSVGDKLSALKDEEDKQMALFEMPENTEFGIEQSLAYAKSEQDETISARTRFEKSVMFSECGHVVSSSFSPPPELYGKEKEAVQEVYSGFQIAVFSSDEVLIKRAVELYCPKHYVLKKSSDQIVLYCSTADGENELIKVISISIDSVSNELYAELLRGKAYDSLLELEAALEDIAS